MRLAGFSERIVLQEAPDRIEFIWSLDLSAGYWILKYMHTETLFSKIIIWISCRHIAKDTTFPYPWRTLRTSVKAPRTTD